MWDRSIAGSPFHSAHSASFTVLLAGKICLDPSLLPDGKQQAKQPLARHRLLAAPPIQVSPVPGSFLLGAAVPGK